MEEFSCPYIISDPKVVMGKNENIHEFAGAYFTLFNNNKKMINKFSVSMLLYDSEGNNPFVGSNCIVSTFERNILPTEIQNFVLPLDPYLSVVPKENYQIGFMYLREIHYADGSVWTDPFGMFAIKEIFD